MAGQWQRFFESHAPHYDQNVFAQNTQAEIDFFTSLFALNRGASVLDVGCGTGRHCLELARRGYAVTGLDRSPAMLAQGRAKAAAEGLKVEWLEADATDFDLGRQFDAAVCLCEGAMGLIEDDEDAETHDAAILRNIARALRPHAPFLLTTLNAYQLIRKVDDETVAAGGFDPVTMVARYQDEFDLPEGKVVVPITERLFTPPEMVRMLGQAGFVVDNVFGGTAGSWGRRPLSLDEIEAMYVCRRK